MSSTEKTRVLTAYRVLKSPEPPSTTTAASSDEGFKFVASVRAASAAAAVKVAAEKAGEGTYVAIPESSWKPTRVTISQQTIVKLG